MAIRSIPVLGDIFGRGTGGRGVRHVLGPDGSNGSVSGPFRVRFVTCHWDPLDPLAAGISGLLWLMILVK
jgi:hypothetical protein